MGPIFDSPPRIDQLVMAQGCFVPAGSTAVGITLPLIRSDQSDLHYSTRKGGAEFRFKRGTLTLNLCQEIHLSNALSTCARTIWFQHEQRHAAENFRLLCQMDAELRADEEFCSILVKPAGWTPVEQLSATGEAIQARVEAVFQRLNGAAAAALDTAYEWAALDRQVRARCKASVAPVLRMGMYGHGIDIVQVALNNQWPSAMPPLAIDADFGLRMDERVREFQRLQGLEEDGIVAELTRARLGL